MVNDIIGIFLFISIVSWTGNFIYTKEVLRTKTVKGKIDLLQLIILVLFPIVVSTAVFFIFINIKQNPFVDNVGLSDDVAFFFLIFFTLLSAVGNGMHAASKTVSNYLRKTDNEIAFEVNEFFHIHLSHFLIYIGILFLSLTVILFELNHPGKAVLSIIELLITLLAGALFGASFALMIYRARTKNVYLPLSLIMILGLLSLFYSIKPPFLLLPATIYLSSEILSLFFTSLLFYYKDKRSKRVFLVKF